MKILVAGDFCPRDRVANLLEKEDYSYVFGDVKNIILDADYSIVNFECPVVTDNAKPVEKLGPNLKCSTKGIEAVKWMGFNCVTLANNHFYDYGEEGVINTIDSCKKEGVDFVGGGKSIKEAAQVLYKIIDGKTLAVVNCCEHEFSIATEVSGGSNPLNPIQQYYTIKEAREKADYVLVIVHGGHEHWQLPSPRMVETYRFFIDAGADAVVNHHQHCFSGYEIYNGKPILYGLGNFCFDNPKHKGDFWNEGYMVILHLKENIEFDTVPYCQCADYPKVTLLKRDVYDSQINKLNSIINNQTNLLQETAKYYDSWSKYCGNLFEPIRNRLYLTCKQYGWLPSLVSKKRKLQAANYILCESHRDKLAQYLCK